MLAQLVIEQKFKLFNISSNWIIKFEEFRGLLIYFHAQDFVFSLTWKLIVRMTDGLQRKRSEKNNPHHLPQEICHQILE